MTNSMFLKIQFSYLEIKTRDMNLNQKNLFVLDWIENNAEKFRAFLECKNQKEEI